ncbi:MAG: (d)CMP kinase [Leptospiraceae bacterium]|nr:(d)CMP kinase [Leptospiraceae bacterium]MCZ8347660.1 (d)CMP kinase [Leptospiraceae bacterium]
MNHTDSVIAIDGPAGSGKSTVAREIAKILGIHYLDSGAFYRTLTLAIFKYYKASESQQDFADWIAEMQNILPMDQWQIRLDFGHGDENKLFLNSEEVTSQIRTPEITEKIKYIADKQIFRDFVNERIRALARDNKLVMDGRDIGTEVFPDSRNKFFLTASPEVRAKRRMDELLAKKIPADWEEVYSEMVKRDDSDRNRKIAPLLAAKDAILIDTDSLSIKLVIETILSRILESKS